MFGCLPVVPEGPRPRSSSRAAPRIAGGAQGVKREVDPVVRIQAEKILRDLDIVKREEFEAVKDMGRLAREENEALKARIAALEARLGVSAAAPEAGSPNMGGSAI